MKAARVRLRLKAVKPDSWTEQQQIDWWRQLLGHDRGFVSSKVFADWAVANVQVLEEHIRVGRRRRTWADREQDERRFYAGTADQDKTPADVPDFIKNRITTVELQRRPKKWLKWKKNRKN